MFSKYWSTLYQALVLAVGAEAKNRKGCPSSLMELLVENAENKQTDLTSPQTNGGFPGGSVVKSPPASAGDTGDSGSTPGLGRSPGGGHGNPLQYSCLQGFLLQPRKDLESPSLTRLQAQSPTMTREQ